MQDEGNGVRVELQGDNSSSPKVARGAAALKWHPGASTDRQVCSIKPVGKSHKPEAEIVLVSHLNSSIAVLYLVLIT